MADSKSDTPRTEALIRFEFGDTGQPFPAHALLAMMQHARQLERELAAEKADAERYRWLRDRRVMPPTHTLTPPYWELSFYGIGETFDALVDETAAIDATRSAA